MAWNTPYHAVRFSGTSSEGIPDYDGYADKMNTQLASGSAPDLFIFSPNPTTFQYYESDALMDFTEELSGPWSENFVAGYIEASTRDGLGRGEHG